MQFNKLYLCTTFLPDRSYLNPICFVRVCVLYQEFSSSKCPAASSQRYQTISEMNIVNFVPDCNIRGQRVRPTLAKKTGSVYRSHVMFLRTLLLLPSMLGILVIVVCVRARTDWGL